MTDYIVESNKVATTDGVKLQTRLFKPIEDEKIKDNLVVVLVHPYCLGWLSSPLEKNKSWLGWSRLLGCDL
uniref:Uncharacterized protein MANES_14G015500 n=1 Tax=Rhizophora mucronata TaxID=61149 RepID=A0A2P2QBG5_RHIMU